MATNGQIRDDSDKLTDRENEVVSLKWFNGCEISRNDLELMPIETDMEVVVDAGVD